MSETFEVGEYVVVGLSEYLSVIVAGPFNGAEAPFYVIGEPHGAAEAVASAWDIKRP